MLQMTNDDNVFWIEKGGSFYFMSDPNSNAVTIEYLYTPKTNQFVEQAKTQVQELYAWLDELFYTIGLDSEECTYIINKINKIMELLNKA